MKHIKPNNRRRRTIFCVLTISIILFFSYHKVNPEAIGANKNIPNEERIFNININLADYFFNRDKDEKDVEEELFDIENRDNSTKKDDVYKIEKKEDLGLEKNSNEKGINYLNETVTIDNEGRKIVKNVDDILVLVNKERNLPKDYIPKDLKIPNIPFSFSENLPKKNMRKEAADALELLINGALKDNIELYGLSGYRSYNRQASIYNYKVKTRGEEEARKYSAYPGQSEHQTGLAMDLTSKSVGFKLVDKFGQTPEGMWLKENAHKYGFIIRYQKGKEDITGYNYEPWHIRYVGEEVAKVVFSKEITLEEYFRDYL